MIEKLIKKGEEDKKSITKTFRLRYSASEALAKISEFTGVSQNETVNILIEDTFKTLEMFEQAKLALYVQGRIVKFSKNVDAANMVIFIVEHQEEKLICRWTVAVDDINGEYSAEEVIFLIEDVFQLMKYGIDSTYTYSEK